MDGILAGVGKWERHLCEPFTGRKIICSFDVLASMTGSVARLQRWGAQRPLLIADGIGTGPIPRDADADIVVLEVPEFESLTDQVRARMQPEARLTPAVVEAVDRYDPIGDAVWWVGPPTPNTSMLSRQVLGGRPPHQAELEDKMIVDRLLDEIDASRAPSVVCGASYAELTSVTRELQSSTGVDQVVWAGDNRDGVNGGGEYIRWIRTPEHARSAAAFFADNCAQVRISPFLEGIPCSIHGVVLPDGVVVLRPVELVMLRKMSHGVFLYSGMGTSWDPPPADAAGMRSLARTMGQHLQRTHGYRGAFGFDGVLTQHGFRVTELNTRFSGGLTRLAGAAPDAQLELVQVNAVLGRGVGRSAAEIESLAQQRLEENRFVDLMGMSSHVRTTETTQIPVTASDTRLEAVPESAAVGTVHCGPSGMGTFVRLTLADDVLRRGDRAAALGVLLLEFSDRTFGTNFGAVSAPSDVRRG